MIADDSCPELHVQQTGGRFTVTTFNIHYISALEDAAAEGLTAWDERREAVAAAVEALDSDLIAFQEMETFAGGSYNEQNTQLDFLLSRFPGYEAAATGDPREYPSTQPVLYRRARFEPLEQGFFFYSPTPDELYSRSWDGRFPAFTSWVRFRDLHSQTTFFVFNNHFDAGSPGNRRRASELLLDRLAARSVTDDPVIVLGDFNAPHFFPTVRALMNAGLHRAPASGSTFHFNRGIHLIPAVDHILASACVELVDAGRLTARYDGRFPSDHYPVSATVALPATRAR